MVPKSVTILFLLAGLFTLVNAGSGSGETKICTNTVFNGNVLGQGCFRYVRGYDITGVTNTVEFDSGISSPCDCVNKCIQNAQTCASWVWKFTAPGQTSRTCTLYSNFNLPPAVTLGFNVTSTVDGGLIEGNPQGGGIVPFCTIDNTATGARDRQCVSGALWQVGTSAFLC